MPLVDHPVPPARPALVAAAVRKASRKPVRRSERRYRKMLGLNIPVPPTVKVVRGWPEGYDGEKEGASVVSAGDTIYAPERLDRDRRSHEEGHLLDDQILANHPTFRSSVMRRLGWGDDWYQPVDPKVQSATPGELFADYYMYLRNGSDPRHYNAGLYLEESPKLKDLLWMGRALERIARGQGLTTTSNRAKLAKRKKR